MSTNKVTFLVLVATLLAGMACGMPFAQRTSPGAEEPGADQPQAEATTSTPTATIPPPTPTRTLTQTVTPTHTLTPTPSPPMVSPIENDVLCYFGPGDVYLVDGALMAGEEVPVLGKDEWSMWWQIENPRREGKFCWVSAEDTVIAGDIELAEVVEPPLNFVSSLSVDMSPSSASITCGTFPYTFDVDFTLEITGPCTVTLERILSDGHTSAAESHKYTAGGTKTFSDYYRVGDVGTYWFRVHVISPNDISAEATSEITCTP